jgi:hypothetical protein
MDLTKLNIKNLVSLWQKAGEPTGSYMAGEDFDYCLLHDSDWPNRLWFHQEIQQKHLEMAKQRL